jgi:hypothetical protein
LDVAVIWRAALIADAGSYEFGARLHLEISFDEKCRTVFGDILYDNCKYGRAVFGDFLSW